LYLTLSPEGDFVWDAVIDFCAYEPEEMEVKRDEMRVSSVRLSVLTIPLYCDVGYRRGSQRYLFFFYFFLLLFPCEMMMSNVSDAVSSKPKQGD